MPYRCRKLQIDDVEYFEPSIDPPLDELDIAGFIGQLAEPDRTICRAVVIEGERISRVAATCKLSCCRVRKILRTSLLPLARDFALTPK